MVQRLFVGILLWLAGATAVPLARAVDPAPDQAAPDMLPLSLYDSRTVSAGLLSPEAMARRAGWMAIPENTLIHSFTSDAIFMNDRLAVALRRGAGGAEVYSRDGGAWTHRVFLNARSEPGTPTIDAVRILENSGGAIMLEVTFAANAHPAAAVCFRLTAGERLLEVRSAAGARTLSVTDGGRYLVAPDFFADDLVFDPTVADPDRPGAVRMPVDNALLSLVGDGSAIVGWVWRVGQRDAEMQLAEGNPRRAIASYSIGLVPEKSLWMAVLEGPSLWHAQELSATARPAALDWKPPFPAKWRATFMHADGTGRSCLIADRQIDAPQPSNAYRAWSDADKTRLDFAGNSPRLAVTYPIDRSRATPLTAYCLVDVMRNALGVGPCQYVLDAEGLGGADTPTPEPVTHRFEKQMEKKAGRRDPDAMREQLVAMAAQVQRTDARISRYRELAHEIRRMCDARPNATQKPNAAERLGAIAGSMEQPDAQKAPAARTIAPLVEAMQVLAPRDGALEQARELGAKIRDAGADQDYDLARLRAGVRRLRRACQAMIADNREPDLARQILRQIDQMMEPK